MNGGSRVDKFWIAGLSLMLGVVLWLQVQAQTDQTKERAFTVPVELQNMPPGLTPLTSVREVEFVATGPSSKLDTLKTSDWRAVVDVTRATPGEKLYTLRATGPTSPDVVVQPRVGRVTVNLVNLTKMTKRVSVEETGRLLADLNYGGAKAEPEFVELIGPEPAIQLVARVRAFLDLSKLRPGDTPSAIIEALSDDGRPLPNIRIEPPSITIRPKVVAAPATVDVFVTPKWRGQPAFGFEITSVEVVPNQVTIRGASRLLSSIPKLQTEPIDLKDVKADRTFTSKVVLPAGIQTDDDTTVTIKVRVARTLPESVPVPNPTPAPDKP
jgi:YbbR domain-containing protein